MKRSTLLCWLIGGGLVYTYFLFFPVDLELLLKPVHVLLQLSHALSPWAYGLIAAAILCWTAVKVSQARK